MAKKLGFKDFLTVDYAPGMPDLIKKNAKKRKLDTGAGTNAEYSSTISPEEDIQTVDEASKPVAPQDLPPASGKHAPGIGMGWTGKHKVIKDKPHHKHVHVFQYESIENDDLDEALTPTQRRARARLMKRFKSRIKMGQERAKRRTADLEKLKKRAKKQARNLMFTKLAKGKSKEDMTFQMRQQIEDRLNKPAIKKQIERLAVKLIPQARRREMERKSAKSE